MEKISKPQSSGRRQRLLSLLGLCILPGFLVQCLQRRSKSLKPTDPLAEPTLEQGQDKAASKALASRSEPRSSAVALPSPVAKPDCPEINNRLAWEKLALAPEAYEARVLAYGSEASALVAIGFPKYQHGDLSELMLVNEHGDLIAFRGIIEHTDVGEDLRLKPLLFDNLGLDRNKGYGLVLRTSEDLYFSYRLPQGIEWQMKFRGLDVYGLDPSSLGKAKEVSHLNPIFLPDASQFPFAKDEQEVVSVGEHTSFKESLDLQAYTITDVMGQVLAKTGEVFQARIGLDVLVCYRLVANKYYLRTLVKML